MIIMMVIMLVGDYYDGNHAGCSHLGPSVELGELFYIGELVR